MTDSTVTKADLVEEVVRVTELPRKESESVVETIFESIIGALQGGDRIEIRGFGSFRTRQRRGRTGRNPKTGAKVEVRNQARVHLWYPKKHGLPYPALHCSTQGIDRFLMKNTQVGIHRTPSGHDVYAPNGFDDIAKMIVRPNHGANFSAVNYEAKVARWKTLWPEITVLPAGAITES